MIIKQIIITFILLKQNPDPTMFIGAVKWFDNKKGFGILAIPLGEEVFLHIRGFRNPPQEGVRPTEVIVGDKKSNPKRGGFIAHNCRTLELPDDWTVILSLLGKADTVQLPDKGKKNRTHSLTKLAAVQLLRGKDPEDIFNIVASHFDSNFEPALFIQYASFLEKNIAHLLGNEPAAPLLSRIFGYFGTRITHDILFRVWKAGKFRYIGYDKQGDYEIPEEVLNLNATEIGHEELLRIREYSFGPAFCSEFVNALLDGANTLSREEIDALVPYLDFLENDDREYWKSIVNI